MSWKSLEAIALRQREVYHYYFIFAIIHFEQRLFYYVCCLGQGRNKGSKKQKKVEPQIVRGNIHSLMKGFNKFLNAVKVCKCVCAEVIRY